MSKRLSSQMAAFFCWEIPTANIVFHKYAVENP